MFQGPQHMCARSAPLQILNSKPLLSRKGLAQPWRGLKCTHVFLCNPVLQVHGTANPQLTDKIRVMHSTYMPYFNR